MHKVFAPHLVQRIEDGDLEVFHMTVQLVLSNVNGLIAVVQELSDKEFMHRRTRLALRPHLVDGHAQRPRSHAPKESTALDEQCLAACSRSAQRRANTCGTTPNHEHVGFYQLFGFGASCRMGRTRSKGQWRCGCQAYSQTRLFE